MRPCLIFKILILTSVDSTKKHKIDIPTQTSNTVLEQIVPENPDSLAVPVNPSDSNLETNISPYTESSRVKKTSSTT
jgi:hypothetical protein